MKKLKEIFLYRCIGCLTVIAYDYKQSAYGWCGSCKKDAPIEPIAIDFITKQFVTIA